MMRNLKEGGRWFIRNAVGWLGNAFRFDPNTDVPNDPLDLSTSVLSFNYTPAGVVPEGAYNDPLDLSTSVLSFNYTPAGEVPEGAYNDDLNLSTSIVNFSYA